MTSAPVRIADFAFFLPSMILADLASSRSYICLKERAYHMPLKAIQKFQIARRIFNSIGRQEVKLSNDEVSQDKLLTYCGTDQECVIGENYRFGYKASGDTQQLVSLCKEYGLDVCIVSHVMDNTQLPYAGAISSGKTSNDKGQVSSTRVRHALAMRDMDQVTQLLGRKHLLVLMVNKECRCISSRRFLASKSCLLNLPPGDGQYDHCNFLVDNVFVADCRVVLDAENLDIELYSGSIQDVIQDGVDKHRVRLSEVVQQHYAIIYR